MGEILKILLLVIAVAAGILLIRSDTAGEYELHGVLLFCLGGWGAFLADVKQAKRSRMGYVRYMLNGKSGRFSIESVEMLVFYALLLVMSGYGVLLVIDRFI